MKIIYRHGDLLEHPGRFILQGCNAQGKMGSGVAKYIMDRYPRNKEEYERAHKETPLKMGQIVVVDCERFVFFNGITQEFYGKDGLKYVDYDAIRMVVTGCDDLLKAEARGEQEYGHPAYSIDSSFPKPTPELAMPLIGAGLAGGDWMEISGIIERYSMSFQPIVYIREAAQYRKVMDDLGLKR